MKPTSVQLTTELPGRTTAFLTSDVRPQVGGLITQRTFVEGSDVKAGQQLYQIDPSTYQASYDGALAAMEKDKAALETAKAKAARYKPLAAAQAVSRQDYDDARASSDEAAADILSAKASILQAKINLDYSKVTAPISGRIGKSSVTPGALVTASQTTALATVTQLDPVYVDLIQPANTILRLRREQASGKLQGSGPDGTDVSLLLDDGTIYEHTGKLQFAEVNVDQSTGTVDVRAIFPNPDHLLLPGLYVRAVIREGTDSNALTIPQQAVSHNTHGDATVLVVGPDNKVAARTLEGARAVGNAWMVTGGIAAGDRVIVDGLQNARVGAEVRAVEADPAVLGRSVEEK